MKKTLLACVVASLLIATIIAVPAYAANFQTGESVTVQSPVTDDLYIAGQNIVVSQDVTGDLYVAGMSVQINANVSGDLTVVAQTITINGNVGDDTKLLGESISLNGSVGDDLMTGGSGLNISATSTIGGTIYAFSNTADIGGVITGDLKIFADSLSLSAQVGGDAEIDSGTSLSIADTAKINGGLTYSSPKESEIPTGVVLGEVAYTSNLVPEVDLQKNERSIQDVMSGVVSQVSKFLGLLFIGFIMLIGLPYSFKTVSETTKASPLKALWYGLLFVIAVPVLSFFLIFTIIGLKFAGIMMVIWLVVWPFGKIYGSYYVMRLLIKPSKEVKFWREFGVLTLGLFALVVARMIPFVGWIVWWGVTFVGIGGLLLLKFKVLEMLRRKKMV